MCLTVAEHAAGWVRMSLAGLMLLVSGLAMPLAGAETDEKEEGFKSIFDGKTLEGWDGNPKFWRVEQGAITGETTAENPTKGNTFIIWRGGKPADFELKLQYRIVPKNDQGFGNSGIQYRSFEVKNNKWVVGGYQADFEAGDTYSGILYGERFRGILANRGQKTVIGDNHKPKVVGSVGDSKEIQSKIKKEDWNDYHVIARGFHFVHRINGVLTAECTDEDKQMRRKQGILALQLHAGPAMKVQFRDIRLKTLRPKKKTAAVNVNIKLGGRRIASVRVDLNHAPKVNVRVGGLQVNVVVGKTVTVNLKTNAVNEAKKIVFIAGRRSHGYGAHEHRAGCMLLAEALNNSGLPLLRAEVVTGGWPKDAGILDDAATMIIYADGGSGHPFNKHIEEIDRLMKKGVGLVCIHYGVEVPQGKSGDAFLDWTGGYFETHWSVNPHWTAKYQTFPSHEITNGLKPFAINDEWYYHMRFREKMQGVTPILTDLPPQNTLQRKNGPHSGNPFVREAIANGRPQHLAWARQRPDGGRGFGFTGGHVHWNWGNDQFRKLVLNAVVWTARLKVPQTGVPSKPLSVEQLMANQDYDPPANFNPTRIQALLDEWNRTGASKN